MGLAKWGGGGWGDELLLSCYTAKACTSFSKFQKVTRYF